MANRLASETSPYLLQHKDNPVDWYPWGEEALARARDEDRPILLSIGYSACHWCHVMERESFEDPQLAAAARGRRERVGAEPRPDPRRRRGRRPAARRRREPEAVGGRARTGGARHGGGEPAARLPPRE